MQRVRVGLTGMAAILMLVLIAAIGFKTSPNIKPLKGQSETLAVLGVAPSSGVEPAATRAPVEPRDALRKS
jgi:hypothetical protein